jgi:hypothetical protein
MGYGGAYILLMEGAVSAIFTRARAYAGDFYH